MSSHFAWLRAFPPQLGRDWRAVLVAAMVALAIVLLGRMLRLRRLEQTASGLGLAAGWSVLVGASLLARTVPERLPALALLIEVLTGLGASPVLARLRRPLLVFFALIAGWWLLGAGAHVASALPGIAIITATTAAASLGLAEADPWRVAASSVALAAALHALAAPPLWPLLALVPAGAVLGGLAAPGRALAQCPPAVGIGAVAGAASVFAGRLMHGRVGPVDAAILAPLATAWLASRLTPRLRRTGGLAAALAALLALAMVAFLVYALAALAGLR